MYKVQYLEKLEKLNEQNIMIYKHIEVQNSVKNIYKI